MNAASGATRAILQRAAMLVRPLTRLLDTSPLGLAERLLDEIARGMVPVWPSTERYAARLVEGLEQLVDTRGVEVMRAIALAPEHGALDWREILGPLTR